MYGRLSDRWKVRTDNERSQLGTETKNPTRESGLRCVISDFRNRHECDRGNKKLGISAEI
jgi:hypothetical protein